MSVWRILKLVRGQLPRLGLAAIVAAAAELSGIGLIATATWLLARAAESPPLTALTVAIVSVRALALSRGVMRYVDRLVGHDAVLRALSRLRVTVFKALEPLAPMGSRLFRGGDLLTRFVSDVDAVQDLLLRIVVPAWTAAVVAVAVTGFTAVFSPAAALVLAGCLLLLGVVLPLLTGILVRRNARRIAQRRAALASATVDLIHGSADLAAYGATGAAVRDGRTAAAALAAAERRSAGVVTLVVAAHTLIAGLGVLGVALAADGLGIMTAVLALTALTAFETMSPLPQAARRLVEVREATDRLTAVLDAPPPVPDPADPAPAPVGESRLVLRGAVPSLPARPGASAPVTPAAPERTDGPGAPAPSGGPAPAVPAALDGTDAPAGRCGATVPAGDARAAGQPPPAPRPSGPPAGVDLDLPPGRRVAITGASGAGKSMLLAMLARFTGIAHGQVSLGGADLESLRGSDVRDRIGGMLTDARVFNSDVRENLLVADPGADDDTLRTALARAGLAELDLDTAVGEDGRRLSGGQRQRLLLARALAGRHQVLLLDEPTEHLDPDTAAAVMGDLVSATDGRSLVCVTHHLAHLDAFDEILVLEAGSVVQRGTRRDLLETDGPFRRLAGTFADWDATTRS